MPSLPLIEFDLNYPLNPVSLLPFCIVRCLLNTIFPTLFLLLQKPPKKEEKPKEGAKGKQAPSEEKQPQKSAEQKVATEEKGKQQRQPKAPRQPKQAAAGSVCVRERERELLSENWM